MKTKLLTASHKCNQILQLCLLPIIMLFGVGQLKAQWSGLCPETTNCDVGIRTNSPQGYFHVSPTYTGGIYPMLKPLILADMNLFGVHQTVFTANNAGRVGVGIAFPLQKFHVLGNTLLEGDVSVVGDFTVGTMGVNQFKVTQSGLLIARQVDVHLDPIPDYVFHAEYNKDSANHYMKTGKYKKHTLYEIEDFVKRNFHLPGIKSASQYESIGTVNLGELNAKLLEKVEELTLHTISQQRAIDNLKERLEKIESVSTTNNQFNKSKSNNGLIMATFALFAIIVGRGKFSKLTKK